MRSTVQTVKGQSSHWSGQADDSGYETVGHMTVGATSSVDVSPIDLEEVSTPGPQSSQPAPIKPSFQRVQSTKAPLQPSRPTVPAITPSQGVKPQFSRNLPSATGDNYATNITPNSRPATLAGAAGDALPDTRPIGGAGESSAKLQSTCSKNNLHLPACSFTHRPAPTAPRFLAETEGLTAAVPKHYAISNTSEANLPIF